MSSSLRASRCWPGKRADQPNHQIQGGGYNMASLHHIDPLYVDGYIQVTDEQAVQAARDLARLEGVFAGFSSGANLAAAVQMLKGNEQGGTVAIMLCDSGLKYLSTDLWE
jgi:cysteine synthase A